MGYSRASLKGFSDAAQSLKLYRRAELRDDNDSPLIEALYVDPLQNDAVLEKMLRKNTTFLIGRKGTGKSTVFQRAQHEIRKTEHSISAYVDIKTVYESAAVDTETNQKLAATGKALSGEELRRVLLYRSFTKAVFQEVQNELRNQINESFLARLLDFKDEKGKRLDLIAQIDSLLEGAFDDDATDVTALMSTDVEMTIQSKSGDRSRLDANAGIEATPLGGPKANVKTGASKEVSEEEEKAESNSYSRILLKTFDINSIMKKLDDVLSSVKIRNLYVFIDDFSELPQEEWNFLSMLSLRR